MHAAVDSWIDALSDEQRKIAEALRRSIHQSVPDVEERYSFRIPFYHYFGMFCYINQLKNGIDLCFCRGKDLVELHPQLEQRNRTMVASVSLLHFADLHTLQVQELILGAAAWQQEAYLLKRPMVRSSKAAKRSRKQ